jgi:hypothetical protein
MELPIFSSPIWPFRTICGIHLDLGTDFSIVNVVLLLANSLLSAASMANCDNSAIHIWDLLDSSLLSGQCPLVTPVAVYSNIG